MEEDDADDEIEMGRKLVFKTIEHEHRTQSIVDSDDEEVDAVNNQDRYSPDFACAPDIDQQSYQWNSFGNTPSSTLDDDTPLSPRVPATMA